jgi:hypothetical protein
VVIAVLVGFGVEAHGVAMGEAAVGANAVEKDALAAPH